VVLVVLAYGHLAARPRRPGFPLGRRPFRLSLRSGCPATMRYWKHDNHWWAESWFPLPVTPRSPLIAINRDRYIDWIEGTYVWDSKDVRR
jgi:hypothetical protein